MTKGVFTMEKIDRDIIAAFQKLTDENKVMILSRLPGLLTPSQSLPATSLSDRRQVQA